MFSRISRARIRSHQMLVCIGRRVCASRGGFGRPQLAPWSSPSALTHRCGFAASGEPAEASCAYDVLRVAPSATPAEIKTAFRRTARRLHPDAGPPSEADRRTDVFVKAVAAYEILSCERRRALYDAERRWTGDAAKNAASTSDADADAGPGVPWAFVLRHSDVLREYGASVDALVPRGALRREIYAALGDVLAGPELDVEAVASGDAFPKFFEAEERSAGLGAGLGVDLMHVVSGRTLLATVRERVDAAIGASGGGEAENAESTRCFPARGEAARAGGPGSARGASLLPGTRTSSSRRSGSGAEVAARAPPDAVLELTLRGRVVATAVRLVRGGEVVVYDAECVEDLRRGDAGEKEKEDVAEARPRRRREASLLEANANNYTGFARGSFAEDDAHDHSASMPVSPFARERRGPNGEAFVLTGLSGGFDVAAVLDAKGEKTHAVVAHATPGVTHLHWFCARSGAATGRATRAWMPPADLWLARPRSEQHAEGGWYFELPPGPPGGSRVRAAARRDRRRDAGDAGRFFSRGDAGATGSRAERRRDAFEEVADDVRAMSDFFFAASRSSDGRANERRKSATPVPTPPAAALFATAFRALDRERGEDQGAAGAARRAWERFFGKRY